MTSNTFVYKNIQHRTLWYIHSDRNNSQMNNHKQVIKNIIIQVHTCTVVVTLLNHILDEVFAEFP